MLRAAHALSCFFALCRAAAQLLLCQYKLQGALAVQQQLLLDVFEAQQAWRASSLCGQTDDTPAAKETITSAAACSEQSAGDAATADWSADSAHESPATSAVQAVELQPPQVLQVAAQLAAALTGLMADVLLAVVRDAGGIAAGGDGPPKLPCIFPTPLHWSKWLKHSEQQVGATLQQGYAHADCCLSVPRAPAALPCLQLQLCLGQPLPQKGRTCT
jgi:hypothetical protein